MASDLARIFALLDNGYPVPAGGGGGGGAEPETVDVVVGESGGLAIGDVAYLSFGGGSETIATAYKADADNAYQSSKAGILGLVTTGAAAAGTATIQTSGEVSGLSGLVADTCYGLSSTPGALAVTASSPHLGIAVDSSTLRLSGLHEGGLSGLTAGVAYKSNALGALVACASGSDSDNAIGYAISTTSLHLRSRFGSTAPLATVWSGPAPLAYYRWNVDTGATATDLSGNSHDATMPGSSYAYVTADGIAVGPIGSYSGLVLDYSPVSLGGIPLPDLGASGTTEGTLAVWLHANTTTTNEYVFSGAKDGSGTTSPDLKMLWSSNKLKAVTLSSATSGSTSAWQHWVWTRNGTSYNIYLNGNATPDATGASTSLTRDNDGQWLFCANSNRATTYQYDGYAKDFTFFDAELTAAQVTELYNSGTPLDLV